MSPGVLWGSAQRGKDALFCSGGKQPPKCTEGGGCEPLPLCAELFCRVGEGPRASLVRREGLWFRTGIWEGDQPAVGGLEDSSLETVEARDEGGAISQVREDGDVA